MTLDDAKALKVGDILHHNRYKNADGSCQRWKVNGKPKVWKRSPERVRVPLKFGLKTYDFVDETTLDLLHLESECLAATSN